MGILIALPIAAAIAIFDRKKIEEFIFLAIEIIIACIFVTGYLGNTLYGVKAGVILGVCATLYCVVMLFVDHKRVKDAVLTPGFVIGVIIIAVEGVLLIGKTDLGADNDTFKRDAPQILNMYRYSNLGNVGRRMISSSLFTYAPVFSSWCYFCNKLWIEYSDGINLWARQIFIISGMLPFFTLVGKKEYKKQLLITALILILPNIVVCSYNFMPDIPAGVATIYGTLMTTRLFRDKEKYNAPGYILAACLSLFLVCIMKRAGGIYTYGMVSVATVYTFDRIFSKNPGVGIIKKLFPIVVMLELGALDLMYPLLLGEAGENYADNLDYSRSGQRLILYGGGIIIFVFAAVGFWVIKSLFLRKHYLMSALSAITAYTAGIYMTFRLTMHQAGSHEKDLDLARDLFFKFFKMWFKREYFSGERFGDGPVISDGFFIMILLVIIVFVGASIIRGKIKYDGDVRDIVNTAGPVFMGYTIYMLFYCFMYAYTQDDHLVGDSFGYAGRYLGPAVMLVTAVVIHELLCIKDIDHSRMLACAVAVLMILIPDGPFRILALEDTDYWGAYNAMYADAGVELNEDDNVMCLGPDHCQYYVFPAKSWQDYEAADGQKDIKVWNRELVFRKCNYLVLEDYSSEFPETYQDMFEGGIDSIKKMAIYDVVVDENKQVTFVLR